MLNIIVYIIFYGDYMIDSIIVSVYLLVILIIGVYLGGSIKNVKDFSVGSKKFSTFAIMATLSATFIGGGFSMGNAENVYTFGIASIFVLFGFSLQQFLIAKYVVPRMSQFKKCISLGDIIECNYGKMAKIFTGVLSTIVCVGILGVQISAIGYVFSLFLGINKVFGIIIGFTIVLIYSTVGGMKSVVATDVIQFVLLIIAIPLLVFIGIHRIGGLENLINSVPVGHLRIFHNYSILQFIALFIIFMVGEAFIPPYITRLLLSEDVNKVKKATMISAYISVFYFVFTGLIGLIAYSLNSNINPSLAMPYVILKVLPVGLKGLVIAGIISIVMSSADSLLNSATISLVNDVFDPIIKLSDKIKLKFIRYTSVFLGIMSLIFALFSKGLISSLKMMYGLWSPLMVVPIICVIFNKKITKEVLFNSTMLTIGVMILWKYILLNPFDISSMIAGFVFNIISYYYYLKLN